MCCINSYTRILYFVPNFLYLDEICFINNNDKAPLYCFCYSELFHVAFNYAFSTGRTNGFGKKPAPTTALSQISPNLQEI